MHSRFTQRLLWVSFTFLLLLTVRLAILVYQVSPLRNPIFYSHGPYAAAPWLQDGTENYIVLAAFILAALLAINLIFIILPSEWYQSKTKLAIQQNQRLPNKIKHLMLFIYYILFGIFLWLPLSFIFFSFFWVYLLEQWLID
jgi:hypothetical protein